MNVNSHTPRTGQRQTCSALQKACALLKDTAAFTLTEALATVIIVGLATSMLASGVALASKHLASSMAQSESSMLYATLEQVLINELSYTNTIYGSDEDDDGIYSVTGFESSHYFAVDAPSVEGGEAEGAGGGSSAGSADPKVSTFYLKMVDDSGAVHPVDPADPKYGQIAMCDESGSAVNRLLGDSSYSYGLVACVKSLTFNAKMKLFIVNLSIAQSSNLENPLVDEVFTIRTLNTVYLGDTALTDPGNSSENNPHPDTPTPPTPDLEEKLGVKVEGVEVFEANVAKLEGGAVTSTADPGQVVVDENNNVYYVANKTIDAGSKPPTGPATGNSAVLVPITTIDENGVPYALTYEYCKAHGAEVGNLCVGEDGNLYICTQDTNKPPGDKGHWQLVSASLKSSSSE